MSRAVKFLAICVPIAIIVTTCIYLYQKNLSDKALFVPRTMLVDMPQSKYQVKSHIYINDSTPGYELAVDGKYLIKACKVPTGIFTIFDIESRKKVCTFGQIGKADNEFISYPDNIYTMRNETGKIVLFATDMNARKTKAIDLTASIRSKKCVVIKTMKHDNEIHDFDIFYIPHNTSFIATGVNYVDPRDNIFTQPYLLVSSPKGSCKIALYSKLISFNNYSFLSAIYSSTFDYNVNKGLIIQAYSVLDRFNIIDPQGKTVTSIATKGSYDFKDLNKINTISEAIKRTKVCYTDVTSSEKYIYLLFDGRSANDFNTERKPHIEIRKFDWNGNLLKVYSIKDEIIKITYSNLKNKIFAMDTNGCIRAL